MMVVISTQTIKVFSQPDPVTHASINSAHIHPIRPENLRMFPNMT